MEPISSSLVKHPLLLEQRPALQASTSKSNLPVKADAVPERKRLEKACSEFESLFLHYLFQTMRKTVPKTELFSGGYGEEIYTSMMDQELAKELSSRKDTGIADLLLKQFEQRYPAKNATDNLENTEINKKRMEKNK